MSKRTVTLKNNYSFSIFSPRGSGKSTFIKKVFLSEIPDHLTIDLLDPKEEATFQTNPNELIHRTAKKPPKSDIILVG